MAKTTKPHGGHKMNYAAQKTRDKYNGRDQRRKNKIKKIRKSSGEEAARKYASQYGLLSWAENKGLC